MKKYETTDMNLAILFFYLDKKIHNVESQGSDGRKYFIFEDDGTLDEIRLKLFRKELLVEPLKFWESTKTFKNMLYQ
jgi:hypothetical protein